MERENTLKAGKDIAVKSALAKMKTESFVVTVAGATDIYRREQILSQQSQKIDQHIFEVYDNLENQTEKIQEMLNNLKGERDHKDWDLGDVENLDDHLWANLNVALKDIFESGKFPWRNFECNTGSARSSNKTEENG